ncbi:MAG: outer membrane lipoprotein carrier protein LolA [bacterium]
MKQQAIVFMVWFLLFGICRLSEPAMQEAGRPDTPQIVTILKRLEGKMSGIKTLRTSFTQEKNLAVFDRKLILKGTIFLQKPDLFAWHVKDPVRYSLLIKGGAVTQWDEESGKVQHISLAKNPGYQIVTRQLQEWFSGTYTSLLEHYEVRVLNHDPVCLKFDPRKDALASKAITSVTVTFDKDERYIQTISIQEKNGDGTLLTFTDTQLNIPIDARAWEVK